MKLFAFAASNSRQSINKKLVAYACGRLTAGPAPGAVVETADIHDFETAIFSIDRETESGVPELATRFFEKIGAADALLISFAEHNGATSAAWKNLFDWMSRIDAKVYQGKPVAMLAATPGGRAGANVLQSQTTMAPHFGARLAGSHGVGRWGDAYDDAAGALTREEDVTAVDAVMAALVAEARGGG